jgi:hypothetical protein
MGVSVDSESVIPGEANECHAGPVGSSNAPVSGGSPRNDDGDTCVGCLGDHSGGLPTGTTYNASRKIDVIQDRKAYHFVDRIVSSNVVAPNDHILVSEENGTVQSTRPPPSFGF